MTSQRSSEHSSQRSDMLLTVGSPSRPGLGMGSRAINYSWEGHWRPLETSHNLPLKF